MTEFSGLSCRQTAVCSAEQLVLDVCHRRFLKHKRLAAVVVKKASEKCRNEGLVCSLKPPVDSQHLQRSVSVLAFVVVSFREEPGKTCNTAIIQLGKRAVHLTNEQRPFSRRASMVIECYHQIQHSIYLTGFVNPTLRYSKRVDDIGREGKLEFPFGAVVEGTRIKRPCVELFKHPVKHGAVFCQLHHFIRRSLRHAQTGQVRRYASNGIYRDIRYELIDLRRCPVAGPFPMSLDIR